MSTKVKISKINKKALSAIAVVFAGLGLVTLLLSNAAAPGTPPFGLYVSPSSLSPAAGSQFNVSVYANLGPNAVQSITAYLKYDPAKLRLDSADQAGVDPNFTVTSRCTAIGSCKPAGEIVFVAGYSGSSTITPADGILVGNLRFTALTTGAASLTFDADPMLSGFSSPTIPQSTLNTRTLLNGSYTIVDGTAPSVPTGLTSPSKSVTTVNLSWGASIDEAGGSGLAGYKIYRNGTQVGTSTTTSYTDSGLSPNTTYAYTVAAYDNTGNTSAQTSGLSVTTNPDTQAPTVPGKPIGGTVTMTSIMLTWTGSTDNVAVTGYKIYRNGTQVGTSTTTSYTDNGLTPGTSYTYTVSAYDGANNNSSQSQSTALTTAADTQAPTVPGNVTVTASGASGAVVSWSASTDNVAVTSYRVLRNGVQIATVNSPSTTYTNTGLSPGTYSYTVIAVDAAGNSSAASAAKTITIYRATDIDKDGITGISDLNIILSTFGNRTGSGQMTGDINGDGVVNITDITLLLPVWGST